ncbi:unnamed protein product, partial [Rhizoctonia solani]
MICRAHRHIATTTQILLHNINTFQRFLLVAGLLVLLKTMTRSRPSASSLGLIIRNLGGHEYGVRSVTFSPDGRSIASGSYDSTIRLWDADDPFPTPSANHHPFMGHTGAITSISYSSSGNMIASGSTDCTIRLWETTNGRTV